MTKCCMELNTYYIAIDNTPFKRVIFFRHFSVVTEKKLLQRTVASISLRNSNIQKRGSFFFSRVICTPFYGNMSRNICVSNRMNHFFIWFRVAIPFVSIYNDPHHFLPFCSIHNQHFFLVKHSFLLLLHFPPDCS